MKEFRTVVWNFVFACISMSNVVTASHNGDAKHAQKVAFSGGTTPRISGSMEEQNVQYLNDAYVGPTPSSLNQPRNLSAYRRPGTNIFGITSLSWDDSSGSEGEGDAAVSDTGDSDDRGTSTEPSPAHTHTSTNGSKPVTPYPAHADGSKPDVTTYSSEEATLLSNAPQASKSSRASEAQPSGTLSLARMSDSRITSEGIDEGENTDPYAERDYEYAKAFIVSLVNVAGTTVSTHANAPGTLGLERYTYERPEKCMIGVLFGLARTERSAPAVYGVDEVVVNNIAGTVKVVYRAMKTDLTSRLLRKTSRLWKGADNTRTKPQNLSMTLPQGCVARPTSRYFVIPKVHRVHPIEGFALSLDFAVAHRVPRTPSPKPVTMPTPMPSDVWVQLGCTWILNISRNLTTSPLLNIEYEKALAKFVNEELRDLQLSLLQKDGTSTTSKCDWSSPLHSRMHVTVDRSVTPHNWRVQLDLAAQFDELIMEHRVKMNGPKPGCCQKTSQDVA